MAALASFLLFVTAATAGLFKLGDRAGTRQAWRDFGGPAAFAPTIGVGLPLAELLCAGALLFTSTAWFGAVGLTVLLAGFTLGQSDLLRKAMGKKDPKVMAKQREAFMEGARAQKLDEAKAEKIFGLMEHFAGYGFNKSHSTAYAYLAYQTAYLKANHPVEFMAASMTLDMGNTDKLSEFRAEAVRLGIKVEAPSVNRSGVEFTVEGGVIHYALAALKGVGRQAVEAIVAARNGRAFSDVTDFARRINPRAVNKRVLESLTAAGAFDSLEPSRARAHAAIDGMLSTAQRSHEAIAIGQNELFGGLSSSERIAIPPVEAWLPADRLRRDVQLRRLR